jgi:hypothetical protein
VAETARRPSGGVFVSRANPCIFEETAKSGQRARHVVDRPGDFAGARQAGSWAGGRIAPGWALQQSYLATKLFGAKQLSRSMTEVTILIENDFVVGIDVTSDICK